MVVEYSVPLPVVKKVAEKIIGTLNEHEMDFCWKI
jgi:hypothetical protein